MTKHFVRDPQRGVVAGRAAAAPLAESNDTLRWPAWMAYGFAVVLTTAVFFLRAGIVQATVYQSLLILFVLPVVLSALWGGLGPGLVATALAGLGSAWAMLPSERLAIGAPIDVFQWTLLIANGVLISVTSEALHRSRRKAFDRLGALRVSEERLRLALVSANQGLYDLNVQTGSAVVSREYVTMLGHDPDGFEETNEKWIARLHPDDRDRVTAVYRACVAGDVPMYRVEYRQRTADGGWKWILSLGSLVERGEAGQPYRMLGTNTDITDRKKIEEALRERERRYRELFDANPHPMWVYDLETLAFLAVNDTAVMKYGYDRDEFLGMTLKDIHRAEDVPALLDKIAHAAKVSPSGFWRHRLKDGTEISVEITSHSLMFGDRPARLVLANDVTARMAAEQEVLRLNADLERRVLERTEELKAANRELETFAYTVSHDLKAPLRGIDGYSRLLEEDHVASLNDEGVTFVGNIRRGVTQLQQLIDDLLAYSRMERRTLRVGTVDIEPLIELVLHEREADLTSRGVRIDRAVTAGLTVLADSDGLTLALRNLLDNAIKFTRDATPPVIEIGAKAEGDKCVVWVRDNGIGFDMKFHDRLYEIFQRLQRAEDYSGTGIGLTIVRKAVQRMGGRVWAQSEPGRGATFFLELPR